VGLAVGLALLAGLAVSATADAAALGRAHPGPAAQDEQRLAGEHGLWVEHSGRSVVVRWITPTPARGVLEVSAGSRQIARSRTRMGVAHRASFRPGRHEEVVLRYGALDRPDAIHETLISLRPPARPPVAVTGVDSLYVLGDTHGELDSVIAGLRAAGLIDDQLRWSGGRRHVVFAGDLTDRGPDVLGLLWLVYRLEREAEAAGGRVHVVLGNHEIMVMLSDLRYVHPKELQIAELHGVSYDRLLHVRESILGRWLASKPALLRIDRALIAHGGLGERYADYSLTEFEDTLRTYVGEELFARWGDESYVPPLDSIAAYRRYDFFWDPESVFWHREFVQTATAGPLLERVLQRMEADLLVVGHTPAQTITTAYGGRLIAAHTPRHGADLLLLVRHDGPERAYRAYVVAPEGMEPLPLGTAPDRR
jgi:predicted phosphodiesterase